MRKLVSLLLALVMVLSLASVAMADEPYTLDIYWVGNGDNEAVRAGVEKVFGVAFRDPVSVSHRGVFTVDHDGVSPQIFSQCGEFFSDGSKAAFSHHVSETENFHFVFPFRKNAKGLSRPEFAG